jgi:hypothetical protein
MAIKKYLFVTEIHTDGDNDPITGMDVEIIEGYPVKSYGSSKDLFSGINKKYVAAKGDILYFDPECNVPRFKLKPFCEKYDISVSKTHDKATKIFISSETVDKLFSTSGYNTVNKDCFIEILNAIFPVGDESRKNIVDLLEQTESDVLFQGYSAYYNIRNHSLIEHILEKHYPDPTDQIFYFMEANKKVEVKYDIINDDRVYSEDEIIKYLNVDNVMDEESYQNVKSLFDSSDTGNHMLAMEIMANCDYKKSAVYLLLLFEEYHNKISNSPSKKHVNFKSFLKFFSLNLNRNYTLTNIMYTLKVSKLATPENIEMVIKSKRENLVSHDAEDHFTVKTIVPNLESKLAIKESLVNEAIDNNIPYSEKELDNKIENLTFKIE